MLLRVNEPTALRQPTLTAPLRARQGWAASRSAGGGALTESTGGPLLRTEAKLPWVIFLALNAVLFLRPAELVPQLEGVAIYNCLIIACLATSLPQLRK